MIAAFDVHYLKDGSASGAAVLFSGYNYGEPSATYTQFLSEAASYVPGELYRRELPCILKLVSKFPKPPDEMIVDGYVMLLDRPGLGWHLFDFFDLLNG